MLTFNQLVNLLDPWLWSWVQINKSLLQVLMLEAELGLWGYSHMTTKDGLLLGGIWVSQGSQVATYVVGLHLWVTQTDQSSGQVLQTMP